MWFVVYVWHISQISDLELNNVLWVVCCIYHVCIINAYMCVLFVILNIDIYNLFKFSHICTCTSVRVFIHTQICFYLIYYMHVYYVCVFASLLVSLLHLWPYLGRGAGILAAPRDPLRLPAEEDTALHLMAEMEPFVLWVCRFWVFFVDLLMIPSGIFGALSIL